MQSKDEKISRGFLGTGLNFQTVFVLSAVALLILAVAVTSALYPNGVPSPRAAHVVTPRPTLLPNQVALDAAPGNDVVQMFDAVAVDAKVIAELPDGARCKKMSEPIASNVEGIAMSFYQLDCDGTVGFVNAKWVDD